MKIRMVVEMSGSRNGRPWPKRGEIAELPTGEAQHLVDSRIAARVTEDDAAPVETATPPAAETSTPPKAEAPAKPPAEKRRPGRPRKTQSEG